MCKVPSFLWSLPSPGLLSHYGCLPFIIPIFYRYKRDPLGRSREHDVWPNLGGINMLTEVLGNRHRPVTQKEVFSVTYFFKEERSEEISIDLGGDLSLPRKEHKIQFDTW